jgi:hypothetical protein
MFQIKRQGYKKNIKEKCKRILHVLLFFMICWLTSKDLLKTVEIKAIFYVKQHGYRYGDEKQLSLANM